MHVSKPFAKPRAKPRALRTVLALAALLCAAAPGVLRAADKWLRLSSENFDMLSCSSERESRGMLVQLEQFHATFFKLFPSRTAHYKRPLIFVFDNAEQYEPYKSLTTDGKAKNSQGVHFPSPLFSRFIVLNRNPEQGLSTLFHEYTHALLEARHGRRIPLWFNEGTAVVFSTFEASGDKVTVGKTSERHLPVLRRVSLIPAETFLEVNHASPYYNEPEKIPIFYAQSWLLMHRLICGAKNKAYPGVTTASLGKYLILSTDPAVSKLDALQQSFGLDYKGLNKMMQSYLVGGAFLVYDGVTPAKPIRASITCRPATGLERETELAALRARARAKLAKTEGAPAGLLQAAENNPGDPRLRELLAEHAYFAGDSAQSSRHYLEAIGLGSTNPEVYVQYLREVFRKTAYDYVLPAELCADYRGKIDRALELAPGSMSAHEMLAVVEAHSEEPRVPMLGKILEVLPHMRDGRERTLFSIATLLWRFKEHAKSEEYLNTLLKIPGVSATAKLNAQKLLVRIARDTGKPPPKFPPPPKGKTKPKPARPKPDSPD